MHHLKLPYVPHRESLFKKAAAAGNRDVLLACANYETVRRAYESTPIQAIDKSQITMRALIDTAFNEGAKRSGHRIDVLVHPNFPLLDVKMNALMSIIFNLFREMQQESSEGDSEETAVELINGREEYKAEIQKILQQRDRVIVVSTPELDVADAFSLPSGRKVQSVSNTSGEIRIEDIPRLLQLMDGLNQDDEIVIHGANFAECTTITASKLYELLFLGDYCTMEYTQIEVPDAEDAEVLTYDILAGLIAVCNLQQGTNIRLGTVFDPNYKYNGNDWKQSATKDLIGSETHVIQPT